MQPNSSSPVIPGKPFPAPPQMVQQSGGGAGRVVGCAAIGCGTLVLLIVALCGLGYWGIFYSSYPLRMIEAGIEQEGYVEIDGMKGNMSTGVEAEKIRFRENRTSTEWSSLEGLELKYRTTGSWFGSRGFVIESVRLKGARLYAKIDGDVGFQGDLDFSDVFDELADQAGSQMNVDLQHGNIEIRQVLLENMVMIDPDTKREVRIDEIRFDGLNVRDGELVSLGNVTVKADLINITSSPSDEFADSPINRRFEIVLREAVSPALVADLPLQLDLGFSRADSGSMLRAFGDQVVFTPARGGEPSRMVFRNYTPADWLNADLMGIMPSAVDLELTRGRGRKENWKLAGDRDHSLQLGRTAFRIRPDDSGVTGQGIQLLGEGEAGGQSVEAAIRVAGKIPFVLVRLKTLAGQDAKEVWSQTVFGMEYSALDDDRRVAITWTLDRIRADEEGLAAGKEIPEGDGSGAGEGEDRVDRDGADRDGGEDREKNSGGDSGPDGDSGDPDRLGGE